MLEGLQAQHPERLHVWYTLDPNLKPNPNPNPNPNPDPNPDPDPNPGPNPNPNPDPNPNQVHAGPPARGLGLL